MVADEPSELTVDQFAQSTGMTVRNLRAHQARGLLPPPHVRGRTGLAAAGAELVAAGLAVAAGDLPDLDVGRRRARAMTSPTPAATTRVPTPVA